MQKAREEQPAWRICVGILLTYLGMALIGFGGWYSLELSMRWFIYLVGSTVFLAGLFLIWKDPLSTPGFQEEPTQEPKSIYLGKFDLNGYSFRAYERETDKAGRQFRLISFRSLTPEREAAFIRYMVNEGLIENIWRRMSKKIEEEANWAFLQ
jgi:hypothetical protein